MHPWLLGVIVAAAAASACGPSRSVTHPLETLQTKGEGKRMHLQAIEVLDDQPMTDAYRDVLHDMVWRPGYSALVRMAAVQRLHVLEPDQLARTIRQHLSRLGDSQWHRTLCAWIAQEKWKELTPALVSSWGPFRPMVPDSERPEYLAIVAIHGQEHVEDVVLELLGTSTRVSQQGLRTRCWGLLNRIGARDELIDLLKRGDFGERDAFMADMVAAYQELGVVPRNREEILWVRKLRTAGYQTYWSQIAAALGDMDPARRDHLQLRDLAVAVAAHRHRPKLLNASMTSLRSNLQERLGRVVTYRRTDGVGWKGGGVRDRLEQHIAELTWGDLVAMTLAMDAMDVTQVRSHLFDYADRDHLDQSTEYGGIIALDDQGRYEILEFLPRIRHHDSRFNAPQAMLDAGYAALFHFHFHAQDHRNAANAGPGFGDEQYADNLRANCLVLTFVDDDVLNLDYYRHDGVEVDLGTIRRR
jgi:hypothetical protein